MRVINNHIIIEVETNVGMQQCIFDTGNPTSFFFNDQVTGYKIGENVLQCSPLHLISQQDVCDLVGMQVDGLVGSGSFLNCSLLIDFESEQFLINPQDVVVENAVAMNTLLGLPIFAMEINGVNLRTAYDSGAMYAFVRQSQVDSLRLEAQNQQIHDYNPIFGGFDADLYRGNIKITDRDLALQTIASSMVYDSALSMVGVEAFLGNDALKGRKVWLSYQNNQIAVL